MGIEIYKFRIYFLGSQKNANRQLHYFHAKQNLETSTFGTPRNFAERFFFAFFQLLEPDDWAVIKTRIN